MMATEKDRIKDFWEGRANKPVSDAEVTHRDVWQRHLEIDMVKRFVRPDDRVLDVGCGNGYTTRRIAPLVREIVGIDYAQTMITRAVEEASTERTSIVYRVKDVLQLSPEDFGFFDTAISERCLINLESWDQQKQALSNIASVLRPGGRLIFVEGHRQGRTSLDRLRESTGLPTMPTVWHNVDFDDIETLNFLERDFTVEERLHFGVYDFVSRVVHPLVVAPEEPRYEARINEVAALLAQHCLEFAYLSRVIFLVLRRR